MDDDQWVHLSPDRRERIEAGVEALARIHTHRDFHDWHLVGQACLDLQQAVMAAANVDKPTNPAYSTMFGKFIDANPRYRPLAEIDESVRSNAIWMTQNWDAVLEWHTELKEHISRYVNHPTTVRRRFKIDKKIPKTARPPRDEPEDELTEDDESEEDNEEEDETKQKRDKPIHDPAEEDDHDKEPPPPPGPESYIADFEQLWKYVKDLWNHSPPTARAEMTKRITQWLCDSKEVPDNTRVETDLIDESIHDSIRSVNKTDGAEIAAIARRKASIIISEEPQPEHTAMVVRDALSKPIVEGEDIFPPSDDIGAEKVTPEQIIALQPKTTKTEAKVRALHHNNPGWDDATLAKELGYQETTVRRVLDKFPTKELPKFPVGF